jgi:hypothetical protein
VSKRKKLRLIAFNYLSSNLEEYRVLENAAGGNLESLKTVNVMGFLAKYMCIVVPYSVDITVI